MNDHTCDEPPGLPLTAAALDGLRYGYAFRLSELSALLVELRQHRERMLTRWWLYSRTLLGQLNGCVPGCYNCNARQYACGRSDDIRELRQTYSDISVCQLHVVQRLNHAYPLDGQTGGAVLIWTNDLHGARLAYKTGRASTMLQGGRAVLTAAAEHDGEREGAPEADTSVDPDAFEHIQHNVDGRRHADLAAGASGVGDYVSLCYRFVRLRGGTRARREGVIWSACGSTLLAVFSKNSTGQKFVCAVASWAG